MDISKLTDEEIAWYAERDWTLEILGNYSCGLCQYRAPDDLLCIFRECPKFKDDYKDAAEFESRVAAKMASTLRPCENCPDFLQAPRCPALGQRPYYCMLRNARLAVEAEMEQEGK